MPARLLVFRKLENKMAYKTEVSVILSQGRSNQCPNWYQKLVILSYFYGARNQRRIQHVQFCAGNRRESWTV